MCNCTDGGSHQCSYTPLQSSMSFLRCEPSLCVSRCPGVCCPMLSWVLLVSADALEPAVPRLSWALIVSADALEPAVPRLSWVLLVSAHALESAVPRLYWALIVSADALEPTVPGLAWAPLVSADALEPAVPRLSWAPLVSADALEPAVPRLSHIMSPDIMCRAFSSPLTLWSSCLDKKINLQTYHKTHAKCMPILAQKLEAIGHHGFSPWRGN